MLALYLISLPFPSLLFLPSSSLTFLFFTSSLLLANRAWKWLNAFVDRRARAGGKFSDPRRIPQEVLERLALRPAPGKASTRKEEDDFLNMEAELEIRASLARKNRTPLLDMTPCQLAEMRVEFRRRRNQVRRGPRVKSIVLDLQKRQTRSPCHNVVHFIAHRERNTVWNTIHNMQNDLYLELACFDYSKEYGQAWRAKNRERLFSYAQIKLELSRFARMEKYKLECEAEFLMGKSCLASSKLKDKAKFRREWELKLKQAKREGDKADRIEQKAYIDYDYARYIEQFSSSDED